MKLSETDLILTGARIYHLDLARDHLADIILTVGDPDRVPLISCHFQKIEYQHQHRGFIFHTGYYANKRISVLATAMGTQNIDIVLNELDALVNIDFKTRKARETLTSLKIIRLGTSGALQETIALDTIVVSEQAIDFTGVMLYYQPIKMASEDGLFVAALTGYMQDKLPITPLSIFSADSNLLEAFLQGHQCIKGITATCPGFYAAQGRTLRAPALFPHLLQDLSHFSYQNKQITNLEMETATIYGLGKALGHQCCSLNLILLNRITQEFSPNIARSQTHLIEYALEVVSQLG